MLARAPDAVPHPCGGGPVEGELDFHQTPAHDDQRVFHVRLRVEAERELEGVRGDGQGPDAFDREHPRLLPAVAVGDQVQPAGSEPEVVGVRFASGDPVARRGVVPHLHGPVLGDSAAQPLHHLAVASVCLVRSEADGEEIAHLARELDRGRGQGAGDLGQRRVHGHPELGAVERLQEIPAQRERHELGGRERQRRDAPEPVHQSPSSATVDPLGHERAPRRLQGFEVAAERAEVLRHVAREAVPQLLQARPARAFEAPQQVPLAGDLVVPGHSGTLPRFRRRVRQPRRVVLLPGRRRNCGLPARRTLELLAPSVSVIRHG